MELLYLYIDSYRGMKEKEFNFGCDLRFSLHKEKIAGKVTHIIRKETFENALPINFWGEKITNLTMIVGDNGAGKTSIMNCIIDFLGSKVNKHNRVDGTGAFVFGNNGKYYLYVIKGINNEFQVSLDGFSEDEMIYDETQSETVDKLWEIKLIFLTNTLNKADYKRASFGDERKYDFLYDCSLGSLLTTDVKNDVNHESRKNITISNPELATYFFCETYRQVKFVFDNKQYKTLMQLKDRNYPVPLPNRLYINVSMRHQINAGDLNCQIDECFNEKTFMQLYYKKHSMIHYREDITPLALNDLLIYHLCCGCVYSVLSTIFRSVGYQSNAFSESYKINELVLNTESMRVWFKTLLDKIWRVFEELPDKVPQNHINRIVEIINDLSWIKKASYEFITFVFDKNFTNYFNFEEGAAYSDVTSFKIYIDSKNWFDKEKKGKANWFIEFIKKYRYVCNPDYFLDFYWDLSSGENNLLNLFASLYYIFDRDYSNEENGEPKLYNKQRIGPVLSNKKLIECSNVLLLIDEADLTFHPEWQRQYISLLTAFLPDVYPVGGGIQIILTTHSPIILSDIPKTNIEYLTNKETPNIKTFGQNIHTLFANSFFLEKTIGGFAYDLINEANNYLDNYPNDNNQNNCISRVKKILSLEDAKAVIDIIGEDIIRKPLLAKYYTVIETKKSNAEGKSSEIENLKTIYENLSPSDKQDFIEYLDKQQEDNGYDKN